MIETNSLSLAREHARIPGATYRLQLHKGFNFDDAISVLPYLARLGISHVYCSPIQRARPGSLHGYDVVAHHEVNPELGGQDAFERFSAALRTQGLGMLLDIVPNHMGVGSDNPWWMDVLENGAASAYADFFDIDWHPLNPDLAGKVLLPVLGDHYGDVLARGELSVIFDPGTAIFAIHYFDHHFPLSPSSYARALAPALRMLADTEHETAFQSLLAAFLKLETIAQSSERSEPALWAGLIATTRNVLAELVSRAPPVGDAILGGMATLNAEDGRKELHSLIEAQNYRLSFWRVAADEINYRRFFDVNELAALRMERKDVFEATQGFTLDLAAAGVVDGLRIDHPDGLRDPARYFEQLQQGYARRIGLQMPPVQGSIRPTRPLYVVAEKISAASEEIPESWAIHGTTGYRFANVANGVLVDTGAERRFGEIWRDFTEEKQSFESIARDGKRAIIRSALSSELNVLSTELVRIARADVRTRDYTLNAIRRALSEVAACMTVYRTYVIYAASTQDRHFVERAVAQARRESDETDLTVFDFVGRTLLGEVKATAPQGLHERVVRFAIRFQQFSAPVAAKGVEDTAFYRYFPLCSLNEVGGEPATFGLTAQQFHEASADRARRWPHTMLATSTHDNKRSEDVRNRIDVLSEIPDAWADALERWARRGEAVRASLVSRGAPADAPSKADEYLLYQTLLGTLPSGGLTDGALSAYRDRILAYMTKAARESKSHTRWTQPDQPYEDALSGFIEAVLSIGVDNEFLSGIQQLADELAWYGALNSLTLTILKYGSPGVPDLYQGNEVMDLSLVDPDNRRPVDYAARERLLSHFEQLATSADRVDQIRQMLVRPEDGRAKLWLTWRLLHLRRIEPELFRDGSYGPLQLAGTHAGNVLGFVRRLDDRAVIVIVGRLFRRMRQGMGHDHRTAPVGHVWSDTVVNMPDWPEGTVFDNVITGERVTLESGAISMASAFRHFPGAVLRPA